MTGRLPLGARLFAVSAARGLPPRPHRARVERDLPIDAGDVVLRADHYAPDAPGRFPSLLVRSPYGRGIPWGPLLGASFASFGFHVAIVAVRGTGGSAGEFRMFADDGRDDPAVLAWLQAQEWFDGRLATLGPSYLGWTQLPFLADPPPELRAAVLHVTTHDPARAFRPNGVQQLENLLVGSAGLELVQRGLLPFAALSARLALRLGAAARSAPFTETYVRATGRRIPLLDEWLAHPDPDDEFWQDRRRGEALDACAVPVALVGGWHDLLLDQTLEQYARLRAGGTDAELTVGPWTHASAFDDGWAEVFTTTLSFLHRHLGEAPEPRHSRVRVHIGGAEEWRDLPDWPAGEPRTFWLADGVLGDEVPAAPGEGTFRYDPADPPPSIGGPSLGRDAGRQDDSALALRGDVLVFESPPLAGRDVQVLGPVRADLHVEAGHGDVWARLSDVGPDGRSANVCEGVVPLEPGAGPVTVPMSSTAYRWREGHRLRLVLAGGASPRFVRPSGTAEPRETAAAPVPFAVTVRYGADTPSALVLG